ncbi:hypothetical protein A0H81_02880 [Grifola frondosa]|uniref:Uncharacterized protein n=1 Tax=Grifola frondosa TaxID=5627 RepID=A0A1C7MNU1_GRIFR|nr:hypothetical protein A0H81_02880 [Grifola frondosa]
MLTTESRFGRPSNSRAPFKTAWWQNFCRRKRLPFGRNVSPYAEDGLSLGGRRFDAYAGVYRRGSQFGANLRRRRSSAGCGEIGELDAHRSSPHPRVQAAINALSDTVSQEQLSQINITRDYDSLLGVSTGLYITKTLCVYPVPRFADTLINDVHITVKVSIHTGSGVTVHEAPIHRIPNVP